MGNSLLMVAPQRRAASTPGAVEKAYMPSRATERRHKSDLTGWELAPLSARLSYMAEKLL